MRVSVKDDVERRLDVVVSRAWERGHDRAHGYDTHLSLEEQKARDAILALVERLEQELEEAQGHAEEWRGEVRVAEARRERAMLREQERGGPDLEAELGKAVGLLRELYAVPYEHCKVCRHKIGSEQTHGPDCRLAAFLARHKEGDDE